MWLLSLSFALFATAASAPNTFTTTFLAEERGLDLTTASLLAGLVLAGAAIGSVLGGAVSDRIGSRRRVIVGGLVLFAALLAIPFLADGALIPVSLLCLGLAVGAVPAAVFASVPEVVPHPHLTGAGMAGIMLGQNAGFVIGPLVFVVLLPALGWAGTAALFGLVALLGAVVGSRIRLR